MVSTQMLMLHFLRISAVGGKIYAHPSHADYSVLVVDTNKGGECYELPIERGSDDKDTRTNCKKDLQYRLDYDAFLSPHLSDENIAFFLQISGSEGAWGLTETSIAQPVMSRLR